MATDVIARALAVSGGGGGSSDGYTKAEVDALLTKKEDDILHFKTWEDYEKVKNTIPVDTYFVIEEDTGEDVYKKIEQIEEDIAVQTARIDQIIGTVPPGSADEIADARVMTDGKTAANLGDAIRTQTSRLKEQLDETESRLSESINEINNELFTSDTEYTEFEQKTDIETMPTYRILVGMGMAQFPDGSLYNNIADYNLVSFDIVNGAKYKLDRSFVANKVANYATYDADGNLLTISPIGATGTDSMLEDFEIPIPNGCKNVKVCSNGNVPIIYESLPVVSRTFRREIIASAIDESESITKINNELFTSNTKYTEFEQKTDIETMPTYRILVGMGMAQFPDGSLNNNIADYNLVSFDVVNGAKYKVNRSFVANKVANYATYDADGNLLTISPTGATGTNTMLTDHEIPIPNGCKTVKVCSNGNVPIIYESLPVASRTFRRENIASAFDTEELSSVVSVGVSADGHKRNHVAVSRNLDKYPTFPVWGGEYLEHWYEKIYDGTNTAKIDFEGDSITAGYTSATSFVGMRDQAVKKIMKNGGYDLSLLTVKNNGYGGSSTNDWVGGNQYIMDALKSDSVVVTNGKLHYGMNNNPDLMLIGFGMNDAVIDTENLNLSERLELFKNNYEEGLKRIRGNTPINGKPAYNKPVDDLSIIITAPTNAGHFLQESRWYKNWQMFTKEILVDLCRKYQCAFADFTALTYGYTDQAFTSWYQVGVPIHPNKYQTAYWMSALADLIYPVCMHNISID